jgi:integrase
MDNIPQIERLLTPGETPASHPDRQNIVGTGYPASSAIAPSANHCNHAVNNGNVGLATPDKRARRKSMSRRSGQSGYIEKKGKAFHVRFRIDVPGQENRAYTSVRICPISGPGSMTKPERARRAKEIIAESRADSPERFHQVRVVNLGVTFKQQAEWWLRYMQMRKRKPVKPATAKGWESQVNKWLSPNLGEIPVADINNRTLKQFVEKMIDKGLSPQTIHTYVKTVKMIVASAVNEDGEELYPRKWNNEFIDLPEIRDQRTPSFSGEDLTQIVASTRGQFQLLYALLGGTGMRIGEAAGLEIQDISPDVTTIRIRQSVWNGQKQPPKTHSALREIDLCPSLSAMLKAFIGERKCGLLFQTKSGKPISQTNTLRRSLHPILKKMGRAKTGFHGFRRYRVTHMRKNRVPEDLLRFWIGHASGSVTDGYSMVKSDEAFRRSCAANVGLGFEVPSPVPEVAPNCTQTSLMSEVS